MVKGSITMRWAALGTAEETIVAITIRRDMVKAFTSGPFSLVLEPTPHYGSNIRVEIVST